MAAVNRIAEILAAQGDTDPIGVRRARAVGILARPAEALQLLLQHQHDPDQPPQPAESAESGETSEAGETSESDETDEASEPTKPVESAEPGETSESDEPTEPSESAETGEASEPEDGNAVPEPDVDGEPNPEPEPEPEPEVDDHRSLSMALPPGFDAKAARPRVVLFHLSEAALRSGHAIVRPGDGDPLTLEQLAEFLGRSGSQVRLQPVLDPTQIAPVDGYEIPARLRAAVRVRQIADVFPFGTCLSSKMDLDHTERYISTDYGGPPRQTRLGNLGPFARPAHRAATHGGWAKHQPEPGHYIIRSPIGYVYLVTNQGTLALGRTPFSAAIWEAARPKPTADAA